MSAIKSVYLSAGTRVSRGVKLHEPRVTNSCEPSDIGAGNVAQVICKSIKCS